MTQRGSSPGHTFPAWNFWGRVQYLPFWVFHIRFPRSGGWRLQLPDWEMGLMLPDEVIRIQFFMLSPPSFCRTGLVLFPPFLCSGHRACYKFDPCPLLPRAMYRPQNHSCNYGCWSCPAK